MAIFDRGPQEISDYISDINQLILSLNASSATSIPQIRMVFGAAEMLLLLNQTVQALNSAGFSLPYFRVPLDTSAFLSMINSLSILAGAVAPAPARGFGFVTRTFFDDFNSISTIDTANTKAPGFNWYVNNAWPNAGAPWTTAPPTQAGDISVANSVLTLATDRSTFGETLNTAVSAVNANNYIGKVFSGGAYFETRFKFNPATALLADTSWPAFWSTAIEYMANNAAHFGEMDFMEAIPAGTGTVSVNSATLDWTSGVANASTGTNGLLAADANWHTYGRLWVPTSLNGGVGLEQTYIDGVLVASVQYSATAGASPAFSPSNPNGVVSIIDSQHFPLILGAGPSWPVQIDYVAVWQR